MVSITKNEKNYLENNGCKWKSDLHRTYSNVKSYYATENRKVLTLLEKYRKERTVESH